MRRFFPFLFCLGITLLLLAAFSWSLIDQLTFAQRAPTAFVKGIITKVTVDAADSDDASCNALVTFSTSSQQKIEISYGLSSSTTSVGVGPLGISSTSCSGQVGDVVDIAYHISDPNDARVIPPGGFLLGNWLLFVALFFILLVAGSLTLVGWNSAR